VAVASIRCWNAERAAMAAAADSVRAAADSPDVG
jgi:hypothetical protein